MRVVHTSPLGHFYELVRRIAKCALSQAGGKDVPMYIPPADYAPDSVTLADECEAVAIAPASKIEEPERAEYIFKVLFGQAVVPQVNLTACLRVVSERTFLEHHHESVKIFESPYKSFAPIEYQKDLANWIEQKQEESYNERLRCRIADDTRFERSRRRVALGMPPR